MRKTKIVATLGPSSNDVEQLKALIEAGIGAARQIGRASCRERV